MPECIRRKRTSGLNSLKQLADHLDEFEPIAFEKISVPGGLWVYNDGDKDNHGLPVHSSIYANLKTNTPRELMAFPNYPQFHGPHSITTHEGVLNYLRNFTQHFDLLKYITFDTLVEHVSPILDRSNDEEKTKWTVTTKNLNTNEISKTICDSVIVATGKNSKPYIPEINNIGSFKGEVSHVHTYRKPEKYAGKTVVLLGAGPSGIDIAIDLSAHAKKIYLSHRHAVIESLFPANIEQVPGVIAVDENYVVLSNGTKLVADVFFFATGYAFDYSFLDSSCGLTIQPKRVFPLYKQLINAKHPTMAIVGVASVISPFLFPYFQAKYYVAYLRGIVKLPSKAERIEEANILPPGAKRGHYHDIDNNQWSYIRESATQAGFEPLPDYYEKAYKKWEEYRLAHLSTFRNTDFSFNRNGAFNFQYLNSQIA
ncbi:flavin-containing monooxygenase 5-like [Phymastichus coffea]|uniref:flavin-containing monooxygenase 5-like n=1 Tax=Phymastichus coffea TaxID=108790 RepID=UPI00273CE43A|nr:flavin-containing monooxygenase 5-like [Phymastichus coffea]